MTAASTAVKHYTDNRTAVCGKDDAGVRIAILPTLPVIPAAVVTANGTAFTAKDGSGADITGETNRVTGTTTPAYVSNANVARVIVPIDFATTEGAGKGSKYVRKQYLTRYVSATGVTTRKWCYVNSTGWPLKADGTKAKADLSDAADASTTPLTGFGEAVTNFAQPGPIPGTYEVNERQQGYAKFLGWTCKSA
jgi:hypothetical protein